MSRMKQTKQPPVAVSDEAERGRQNRRFARYLLSVGAKEDSLMLLCNQAVPEMK